ncbi:MAG: hypothetical protein US62_C0012G0016 [Candidatus Woesebacteria bacterium GW2011_GWA1_37_8]|uniref:Aminoglycoside phosphotransferase domain-containing protein n=2 Tax=Candidatus Woeseibacteriota TaxID=1752722 RepID=A0A0G0L733_9BACT|nr:MAG: hypothetical protein US39_C0021G0004 [Microgenomates group bacterium GW2011_GWC1_37_12b]KKQ45602.1 MAG: hypothetical protein US62_C0012G0016 [Candidatus Woesebacteria bacterium GW2011_GWA1_37_8]KKQ86822.1 MAG: hypothetical protein UT10_C0016G0016 [Candidatus Woesebacteria bacterium GW2011_GWB1_38_8b]
MTGESDSHIIKPWMRPKEIELRQKGRDHLNKAIKLGLFHGENILSITPFTQGESSVVFKVVTESSPSVVKMTPEAGGVEAESHFLLAWEKEGIKIPQIISIRPQDKEIPVSILVSEFIDSALLIDALTTQQMIEKGISKELGRMLAKMHRAKGKGFGFPIVGNENHGSFETFSEEMEKTLFGDRISWLLTHGVLNQFDVDVAHGAVEILEADIQKGGLPSLTHNDFATYNMFATEPITIFDPDPRITHPAICLAYTLLKSQVNEYPDLTESSEILSGYREITPIDDETIAAGIVLRGIRKIHTWHREGKLSQLDKLKKVIDANEKLIG